jgi:antitoxin (DNA-binding transcriptional repressor) of toxin-antitoxin stability system
MRIQDLKAQLSIAVAEAEAGATIVITRHNQPVAQLGPMRSPHVRYGAKVGTGLQSAIQGGTGGRALELLDEDRGDR